MSKVLARVQMLHSQNVDYPLVHHVLAISHFYKTDVLPDGTEVPMARATYVGEGEFTLQEALDMIKLAISSTGYSAEVTVTYADGMLHDTVETVE